MNLDRAKAALTGTRFADLRHVTVTGSTNADVPRLLAERLPEHAPARPLVLVADHQTAGRGRLDRIWEDEPGSSLLVSIAVGLAGIAEDRWTLVPAAVGVAAVDACATTRLKWPNDLVVPNPDADGADLKVGGILTEMVDVEGAGPFAVVGVGINLNWHAIPPDLTATATSLDEVLGGAVDREVVLLDLLVGLDQRWLPLIEVLAVPTDEFLGAYRARSATLGRRVRVELTGAELIGAAVDIDSGGGLVIEDDQRVRRTVGVGDVVHLRSAAG
ncbi:MAG: biotin--[acetyl-CoA-carboxylase] ligase [Actinobacteria bacterium]|nr:biotin--[acetyl-CoA-carboxylase] ligase [Actinomycetota bacterium]